MTQGCTQLQHSQELHEAMAALPTTSLPIVMAADLNATIGWCSRVEGGLMAHGLDGKAIRMLSKLQSRGLSIVPPDEGQKDLPTSRPRKGGVKGKVIDAIAATRCLSCTLRIVEDSCHSVGTDHELLVGVVTMDKGMSPCRARFSTQPRCVTKEVPATGEINQTTLKQMALEITQPRKGQQYRDRVEVRMAFKQAKLTRCPELWKSAMKMRHECREAWEETRLGRAMEGDWKALKATRQTNSTWEPGFSEALQGEPHQALHDHLQKIYDGPCIPPWNPQGDQVMEVNPFTMEELLKATHKGRTGRAVGVDGIPHELLVKVAEHETQGPKLLEWLNEILATGVMPSDWSSVIMIILPKIGQPKEAKQVRPISVGSAVCKVFSRLLLERSQPLLGEPSPTQCAGRGRQSCDYIFVVQRLMGLEREWRFGLNFIKLDVAKAFDRVSRTKLYSMLESKLGISHISRCWHALLQSTRAFLQTSWGLTEFPMKSGIKQGAVESPSLYSLISDACVREAARRYGWANEDPRLPGLALRDILYMDDSVMWDSSPETLQTRAAQVAIVLKE